MASKKSPIAKALADALSDLDANRAEEWEAALRRHDGVIAHASDEFGFSKQRGYFLTKRYELQEVARGLRAGKRTEKNQAKGGKKRAR